MLFATKEPLPLAGGQSLSPANSFRWRIHDGDTGMPTKQEFYAKLTKAEILFQQGLRYHQGYSGSNGKKIALSLYNKALHLGSARAALYIALLFKEDPASLGIMEDARRYMLKFFSTAAVMGCPDGYYHLYEECCNGSCGLASRAVAEKYLRRAVQEGSIKAMTTLGNRAISSGRFENGQRILERALLAGNGDAGYYLARFHAHQRNDNLAMLHCLHMGGRNGSVKCLRMLVDIYKTGKYGLPANPRYAREIAEISAKINPNCPAPIRDFDRRFPCVQAWSARTLPVS